MISFFMKQNPIVLALFGGLFAFIMTTLGSLLVFFTKSEKLNKLLSFSSGIMLSAAIFSLLIPSIEKAKELNMNEVLVIPLSIICGSFFLILVDKVLSKCGKEKLSSTFSIILHNIPEGFSIGVAFGYLSYYSSKKSLINAIIVTLGIAIQNFPEGLSVSIPLKKKGVSTKRAFIYGMLSGLVEVFASLLGALFIQKIKLLLPYSLAFSAGAMFYVLITDTIPESQHENKNTSFIFTMFGFILMMLMEMLLC